MAIDASIYNAFKPETYGQRQERMMREQAAAQEREFNALRLQQTKAELADKDRMRQESLAVQNALMGATTDDDRISRLTALGTPTAWGQADTLRKGILERQKAEAENAYKQAQADRERLSTTKDKLGLVLNVVSAAKDPVSYQQGLQILQANGVDLAGVPPQFDPKYVANAGQQALTAMQRLEQEWKAKGYDLDVKRQEEAVRHNRTQEGLTARGQNMTDARAREANEVNRQAARTQVVETPEGVMLVDKGTGLARPAATMNGASLPGKQPESVRKELMSIGQQRALISGAIREVDKTPSAFSFMRGAAGNMPFGGESIAGRLDSDAETQARAYIFNNVSRVINERAGAAQSAQELQRLRSFLPADTDAAPQIKSKLKGFETYLADLEKGTTSSNQKPAQGQAVKKYNPATGKIE